MPCSFIFSRFSIMLMAYLIRYLLSKCLRLSQGTFSHSKQNLPLSFWKNGQFFILHFMRVMGLFVSFTLQPGHLFFSLKYAMQIPQFIPQGAINIILLFSFMLTTEFTRAGLYRPSPSVCPEPSVGWNEWLDPHLCQSSLSAALRTPGPSLD